jgi:hypothetical protein
MRRFIDECKVWIYEYQRESYKLERKWLKDICKLPAGGCTGRVHTERVSYRIKSLLRKYHPQPELQHAQPDFDPQQPSVSRATVPPNHDIYVLLNSLRWLGFMLSWSSCWLLLVHKVNYYCCYTNLALATSWKPEVGNRPLENGKIPGRVHLRD